ncbi:MAG: hypothetical protein ACKO4Q_14600, partial [Planctomycetota bacterium]
MGLVALQPGIDGVVVELLRPQEAGVGLARDQPLLGGERRALERIVVGVVFLLAGGEGATKARAEACAGRVLCRPQAQAQLARLAALQFDHQVEGRLGAVLGRIDHARAPLDHVLVEGVLDVRSGVLRLEQLARVRLVLGEEQREARAGRLVERQLVAPERRLVEADAPFALAPEARPRVAALFAATPRPGVAEPHRRQEVQHGAFAPAVRGHDAHQGVVRPGLGVADLDVEVAVVGVHAGVDQLVLRLALGPPPIGGAQILVGERVLRVLVQGLAPRVRRRRLEEVVLFLHVLAV